MRINMLNQILSFTLAISFCTAAQSSMTCSKLLGNSLEVKLISLAIEDPEIIEDLRELSQNKDHFFFDESAPERLQEAGLLNDKNEVPSEVLSFLSSFGISSESVKLILTQLMSKDLELFNDLKSLAEDSSHFFFDESAPETLRSLGLLNDDGSIPTVVRSALDTI